MNEKERTIHAVIILQALDKLRDERHDLEQDYYRSQSEKLWDSLRRVDRERKLTIAKEQAKEAATSYSADHCEWRVNHCDPERAIVYVRAYGFRAETKLKKRIRRWKGNYVTTIGFSAVWCDGWRHTGIPNVAGKVPFVQLPKVWQKKLAHLLRNFEQDPQFVTMT